MVCVEVGGVARSDSSDLWFPMEVFRMKKLAGWCLALALVALAGGLAAPAAAIPEDPPNDNVCICHQTQHHQNNQGNANDNQKGVIICVDPNSVPFEKHTKHGDACIEGMNDGEDLSGCTLFTTESECLGEALCDEEEGPFPECCGEFPDAPACG